jgi:predicted ester cyclase
MNARDVVELAYRTLSERGPDAVAEFVSPEATLVAADGARIEGREKVLDYLRRERAAFSNLVADVRIVAVDEPIVVLEGVVRGRHDRELTLPSGRTLPATGREINLELVILAQVANGRITQVRRYFDRLALMAQLGVLPPIPGAV